jgi:signal transduction histidine kinase
LAQEHADLEARVAERTIALKSEVEQHAVAREEVWTLLRRLVTAQEDQRSRMSRDLHDQLGQQLTALRLALERLQGRCADAGDDLAQARALTREIDAAVDFLAWELRPAILDDLGLAKALPRYLEEWSARHEIPARFDTNGSVADRLSPEAETTFYRITQEALNNVLKHAHAGHVDVLLERRDEDIVLVIEDDGIGFDPADPGVKAKGIGLAGMRERAALAGASFEVESAPGNGTSVFLRCPVGEGGRR